jgi:hypothetical protein
MLGWRNIVANGKIKLFCRKCGRCCACERRIPLITSWSWTTIGILICPRQQCRDKYLTPRVRWSQDANNPRFRDRNATDF